MIFASRSLRRSRGRMPLTVAWVPTGMKTGVSTSPWGVWRMPARARVTGHSARTSKEIWRKSDCSGRREFGSGEDNPCTPMGSDCTRGVVTGGPKLLKERVDTGGDRDAKYSHDYASRTRIIPGALGGGGDPRPGTGRSHSAIRKR